MYVTDTPKGFKIITPAEAFAMSSNGGVVYKISDGVVTYVSKSVPQPDVLFAVQNWYNGDDYEAPFVATAGGMR